jgi:hypothetical protein
MRTSGRVRTEREREIEATNEKVPLLRSGQTNFGLEGFGVANSLHAELVGKGLVKVED